MGMSIRLMADSPKNCLARKEMARILGDLRHSKGGKAFLSSRSAHKPLAVSGMTDDRKLLSFRSVNVSEITALNTVRTGQIDPSLFGSLGTYLKEVRKSRAVLGRVVSGSYCYEARLGPNHLSPASSITLNFVVTKRIIPLQNTPVLKRKLDHERAAMERASNYLRELVARNVGNIEWTELPETHGEPLVEPGKRSYWTPIILRNYCNPTAVFEVLAPVYAMA